MFRTVRSRVVALMILVVAISVALTAVMVSLAQQRVVHQGAQTLRGDADIYQRLLNYGITHPSWEGVEGEVIALAEEYQRRIALGTEPEKIIVDSDVLLNQDSGKLNSDPQVIIDPLNPLTNVAEMPKVIQVDPGDAQDQERRRKQVEDCLLEHAPSAVNQQAPQLEIQPVSAEEWPEVKNCLIPVVQPLPRATATDLGLTMGMVRDCMESTFVKLGWTLSETKPLVIPNIADQGLERDTRECMNRLLKGVTAPPVKLFLGSEGSTMLSPQALATLETALIATCIIAVAGLGGMMIASRIVKPLRTLTVAATKLGDGERDVRVEVPDRTEIGALAETFNDMAESLARSEQARRQLVADIAHELGNPLVTIGGGLEAIQDGIYQPSPEVLASLAEEAAHLQRLVTELRELALADTGNLPITRAEVDLTELATATVNTQALVATAAGIELGVVADGPHPVIADETRLRQVLANLLGNAIHHTPAGGRVEVRIARLPGRVRLEVADTGEGIAPEHLPHVFERFWRADPSRHRDKGRTGLGLAISDTLVRAQGGTISVASTLGQGTTFTIDLPS
ncbi:MAG: ATP-binding protein [Propionibacteriaceae bacterium]|nr:ATP-binding protein [Propionibacteriaceae bacterium]